DEDRAKQREGKPEADEEKRQEPPDNQSRDVFRGRNDAELDDANGPDQEHDDREDQADDREASDELAVDHVIAIDGLGQQSGQCRLRPLAVDRVETEGNAQKRDQERDQRGERRYLAQRLKRRWRREQDEEQRLRAGSVRGKHFDPPTGRLDGRRTREGEDDGQAKEAVARDRVG